MDFTNSEVISLGLIGLAMLLLIIYFVITTFPSIGCSKTQDQQVTYAVRKLSHVTDRSTALQKAAHILAPSSSSKKFKPVSYVSQRRDSKQSSPETSRSRRTLPQSSSTMLRLVHGGDKVASTASGSTSGDEYVSTPMRAPRQSRLRSTLMQKMTLRKTQSQTESQSEKKLQTAIKENKKLLTKLEKAEKKQMKAKEDVRSSRLALRQRVRSQFLDSDSLDEKRSMVARLEEQHSSIRIAAPESDDDDDDLVKSMQKNWAQAEGFFKAAREEREKHEELELDPEEYV